MPKCENFQNYTDIFIYRYVVAFGMQNIKENCMTRSKKTAKRFSYNKFCFFCTFHKTLLMRY